jgi:hypothetical protein
MKINEFNNPKKIEEGALLDILIGPDAAKRFSKDDTRHIEALKYFLKDFVGDALTSLENGIEGGFVDPNRESSTASPEVSPEPSPTAAAPTASPTQVPPAQQTGQRMSPQQTATAKMQTRAGIQPTGQKMTAAQRTNAQLQAKKMRASQKPKPVKESYFNNLNQIFESILSTIHEETEEQNTETIAEYMTRWFNTYMDGVDWKAKQSIILPIIAQIEKTYASDKGRAAIQKLGRVAWDMLGKSPSIPAGAKDIVPSTTVPSAASASGKISTTSQIISAIANLKKTNPYEFNKLSDQLKSIVK